MVSDSEKTSKTGGTISARATRMCGIDNEHSTKARKGGTSNGELSVHGIRRLRTLSKIGESCQPVSLSGLKDDRERASTRREVRP